MLIAVEYLGSVGAGVTIPQFFRASDGRVYVVKLQNNPLGSKVLFNEFLAAQLGKIMGLPFPTSGIIEINEQLLHQTRCTTMPQINIGLHFASLYLESTNYVGKHNLSQVINTAEMAGVLLFDHLFHNADRANNRKNLLIRQEDIGYKIYAIDHSHLFKSGKWTLESIGLLGTKIKPYDRYSFRILLTDYLSPQDFLPYVEKVATISDEDIQRIVWECPNEWLPDKSEREGIAHHIRIRCAMAEKILDILCEYIPRTRGGKRWLYGRIIR